MPENPSKRPDVSEGWRSIRVKNLRSLEDSGEIEYAPITLLFGKNSSGKTTLLRAPLLLKQAIDSAETNEALLAGPYVDFGSYKEMVFNGQVNRDVHVAAVIFADDSAKWIPSGLGAELSPEVLDLFRAMRIEIVIHWNRRNSLAQYQSITISNVDTGNEIITYDRTLPEQFEVKVQGKLIARVNAPLSPQTMRYTELAIREEARDNKDLLNLSFVIFQLSMNLQLTSPHLIHIRPLREMPRRSYRSEELVGAAATDSAVAVLRSGEGIKEIERALQTLGMAKSIKTKKIAPGYVSVTLQDYASGREDNLADVGFGVSQVLPIIATLATARQHTTVLIEQPELHLHPEAQGKLADVLHSLAVARNLRLVIETHSEHLLLRLQRRIAEQKMRSADLALYFVDSGKVSRSKVDRHGQLDNSAVPHGFFEEDWRDLLKLTEAAAKASRGA